MVGRGKLEPLVRMDRCLDSVQSKWLTGALSRHNDLLRKYSAWLVLHCALLFPPTVPLLAFSFPAPFF